MIQGAEMKRIRQAFTLIELLVVIAIIAVLAAILFPVFGQAKLAAKKTGSMLNLRQIGYAVTMYLPDYDDHYPRTMETESTGMPNTVSWWAVHNYQESLKPYMKQERGSSDRANVWWDLADPDRQMPYNWGSFTDNGLITGVQRAASTIANPADTVYATQKERGWDSVVGVNLPANPPPSNDPFWISEFFDMCLDPWQETNDANHPYHWSKGTALPPCSIFASAVPCGEWDRQINGRWPAYANNKPRYGHGQIYVFADGHAKLLPFAATYEQIDNNRWDIY
jgi:prepilin-type N-terminal cleavage/methylation domain-containing protein